jgi:DNA polymerase-1
MPEKLFLIDAMAMIYRAYFAMISHPLTDAQGRNTSAIYGFVNSLIRIIEEENPHHIAVCFDTQQPTFRHIEFPQYKAQRQEIPNDMPWQIEEVKQIVRMFNIPSIELGGYEADDIIGTLVKQAEKEKARSYMVTPDKDYMQLVSENSVMYKPVKSAAGSRVAEMELVGIKQVETKFGVTPDKVIEVLGLMGDASDNIPGVKGVGEKTAIALIKEYGTIDNLYANIDKITKPKLKELLINDKHNAYLARRLVTIKTDVPLEINFHGLIRKDPDREALVKKFEELNMKSFARKFSGQKKIFVKEDNESKELPENKSKISYTEVTEKTQGSQRRTFNSITEIDMSEIDIPEMDIPDMEMLSPPDYFDSEDYETSESLKITISGEKIDAPVNIKKIDDVKHKYYLIKNEDELSRLEKKLMQEELVSFDTETTGVDAMTAEIVGMSFSYQEGEAFYLPVYGSISAVRDEDGGLFGIEKEPEEKTGVHIKAAVEKIKPVLESKKIRKVGQNLKYDYMIMRRYGIKMENLFFDSMIGSYVLNSDSQHGMDFLSEKFLNYEPVHIEELIGKGKNQISMAEVDIDKVTEYAAEDADVTLQLFHRLKFELQKVNLYKLCTELEFPLIEVLAEMELEGIHVDEKILKTLDRELIIKKAEYEESIYESAGEKFNINSTQQLAKILFDKLKLESKKKTKTGFSTDIKVLEELRYQHKIVAMLVDYRMLTKLKSTYVEGLMKAINPKTGRVHTSFNQVVTSTGRLSSVNPNLQNIPIRTEAGRGLRKAFTARNDDYEILSADYSQIELRIMAHCSDDENMKNAFKRGRDIHTETAMHIFGLKSKDKMTDSHRRKAKEVNFGIIYGIGAFGLANRLEIKNTEAKEIIDRYFMEYPKIKDYMERTRKFAAENGYVQTLMGRRRYLAQINNKNATVRAEDERAAINMPIQGTAADMIKIAMINIHGQFEKNKLESKMLLQVHDELVFDVKKSEIEEVKKIVIREMKNALKLNVPVEVEVGTGKNWFDAH